MMWTVLFLALLKDQGDLAWT